MWPWVANFVALLWLQVGGVSRYIVGIPHKPVPLHTHRDWKRFYFLAHHTDSKAEVVDVTLDSEPAESKWGRLPWHTRIGTSALVRTPGALHPGEPWQCDQSSCLCLEGSTHRQSAFLCFLWWLLYLWSQGSWRSSLGLVVLGSSASDCHYGWSTGGETAQ